MEITVWSVAADDDNGTYASVHETELAAYRRLIELTVDSDDRTRSRRPRHLSRPRTSTGWTNGFTLK